MLPRSGTRFALIFLVLLAFPGPGSAVEPLTLEQCIKLALQYNPGLASERAALLEAQASYRVARAGLLPKLSANAYYDRLNADRLSPLGTAAIPSVLYTSGLLRRIRGCGESILAAHQEPVEFPADRIVGLVLTFVARIVPQGAAGLIDVFEQ